jgi:IMP dehydrogenase
MASAMDAVVSPKNAIEIGRLGGLAVLNLEGLWTRYEDPEPVYERIAEASPGEATKVIQDVYTEPMKAELVRERIREIKEGGVVAAASLTPQRVSDFAKDVLAAELDILVIQGTVVSAEHVSKTREPLNLKEFIKNFDIPVIVGGCAAYETAYHLMKTGAIGVLVGIGPGAACTSRQVLGIGVPQATAIADAAAARVRHLEETGRYCHVIADGGMRTGGDISKAIACGADAVMIASPIAGAFEAPGRGYHWGMATFHPELPRGVRVHAAQNATLKEILVGPADVNDGTLNLFGALQFSMATAGYGTVKEFQKSELVVAPAVKSEGKLLQHSQGVGSV